MNALEIDGLYKSFGNNTVINDLHLVIPEHSIFGFMGQNGAGKTTTMKMVLGLLKPNSGNIYVCGEKVTYGETKTNRNIGYLPDVPEFYGYMKPTEYLKLCGEITGLTKNKIKERSEKLLSLVGISNVNKKIGGFSRGMKQRLGIAQALLNEPKLLICDEPTSALDPIGRKEILDILLSVKGKTTVIFSTHILSDVERICDHVAILNKGKIALSGTLSEIKEHYRRDSFIIDFISKEDAAHFYECEELKTSKVQLKKDEYEVIVKASDIKDGGQFIIDLLSKKQIVPVKFELTEPTLESLFMEVVK
ncbi:MULTISPECIES: ABC transporter ATP-binding protein [Clostridium]|uniref:ABC transporter ATP-binding protein n=1 Tax=Clostridium TaxID=1485 RepID=UPI00082670AA|nr:MULTISPECIES: ABC transporter ATP-binding protein [Clostridium]PJI06816.1 ABC transporter ATP-binding protein [Clostridium sp. CT7]